jgi:squalene synthase HpnC
MPLAAAYAACESLAQSHYENFPVASRLLPTAMRRHVAAVYAFARVADDLADEGAAPAAVRRSRLDAWRQRLHDAVAAQEVHRAEEDGHEFVFVALSHSIGTLDLPLSLFDDLVSAFGQDITTHRYASWTELFDYCRRSANPVGRLVLRIAGYRSDALDRSADALCTALQLTNFWQDLGRDWNAGRLYVPREVLDAHGARETDLSRTPLPGCWREVVQACVAVTRECFRNGRAVCDGVRGRLRWELRMTWLGGQRVLGLVEAQGVRLPGHRPTLSARDLPRLLWQAARWADQAA